MYPVTDMGRALGFYREGLGLTVSSEGTGFWVEFDVGGATFGIGNFEQVGTAGTGRSVALEVDDLAAFRTELAGRGIETDEPHETPVCWISLVRDPDGNQLWLHQAKAK